MLCLTKSALVKFGWTEPKKHLLHLSGNVFGFTSLLFSTMSCTLSYSCYSKPHKPLYQLGMFLFYLPELWSTLLRLYLLYFVTVDGHSADIAVYIVRCTSSQMQTMTRSRINKCRCLLTVVEALLDLARLKHKGNLIRSVKGWQIHRWNEQASSVVSDVGWGLGTI